MINRIFIIKLVTIIIFSAMAFLAASFTDDSMRLRATSIAFSGFTVGVTSKLYN